MKKFINYISILALLSVLFLTACKKEKGEHNEEELITSVILKFTPVGGGTTLEYSFSDPDGPGGLAPTTSTIVLSQNTTYNVAIEFKNDVTGEIINQEIEEEADAHRIYYTPAAGSSIQISGLDTDADGVPLGLSSVWTCGASGSSQVTVTLRHYGSTPPDKQIADPVNSPKSSTDAEVIFDTQVQ